MSDDNWNIQFSDTVKGTLINIRANTPEEFAQLVTGLAESDAVKKFVDLKQVVIANNVQTAPERYGSQPTRAVDAAERPANAKPAGNPSSGKSGVKFVDGVPHCAHGAMVDNTEKAIEKGWKNTHYCAETVRAKQCQYAYDAR